jgi:hypothetical protein
MAGRREYRSGRRSAPPQLQIGQILLAFLEAAFRLLSGDWDSSSFSPTYSPGQPHAPSRRTVPVSWRKSMKLAVSEPLPSESHEWSEHRVGLIITGRKAGRYIAVQPSEHDGWDLQISRRRSSQGIIDAYQRVDDTRLQTLFMEWDVRWLPVGIYADAVTLRFFRKAMMGEEDL